jgi:hypothetical protein
MCSLASSPLEGVFHLFVHTAAGWLAHSRCLTNACEAEEKQEIPLFTFSSIKGAL